MSKPVRKILSLALAMAMALGMFIAFPQTAFAAGATYKLGNVDNFPMGEYAWNQLGANLVGDLLFSLGDGDTIIITDSPTSDMTLDLSTLNNITINGNGGTFTNFSIKTSAPELTLQNINLTAPDNAGGNGESAIGFSSGSHTLVINGTVNLTGGDGSGIGGHAAYGESDTELTIVNNGTGVFAGGSGGNVDGHGFSTAESLTVSGNGNLAFSGEAGFECDDVVISGGRVTAIGTQVGAIIGGDLHIGAGAAFIATGVDRGITIKGGEISGAGDLTARATGGGGPNMGTGIFFNPASLTFSLTGNADISGPLGGIGMMDDTLQLTLQDGPDPGNSWVIKGTPQKAFMYYDPVLLRPEGLPSANIVFTGTLAVGTYDTDVNVFTLPVSTPPVTTAPTIISVAPSGQNEDLGGSVVVTFSDAMNPAAGTVSLDNGATTLTGNWSVGDTVYTAPYSGLAYSTQYTITITGFADLAGNAADLSGAPYNFTTKAQPAVNNPYGSGGSTNRNTATVTVPQPVTMAQAQAAYDAALKTARESGNDTVKPILNGYSEISLEILQALAKWAARDGVSIKVYAGQVKDFAYTSRLVIDPAKATKGITLMASADSPDAVNTAARFKRRFQNKLFAVATGQAGGFRPAGRACGQGGFVRHGHG